MASKGIVDGHDDEPEPNDDEWRPIHVSRPGRRSTHRYAQRESHLRTQKGINSLITTQRSAVTMNASAYITGYVKSIPSCPAPWLHEPEVPSSKEIGHIENGRVAETNFEKSLEPNRVTGPWAEGKDFYLETQYQLFREDAITPLRESVDEVRAYPHLIEKDSSINTRIYEAAHIIGITLSRKTLAVKIEFSTRRSEKRIRWAQSKRLKTGTIVALTPKSDSFRTVCKVATVVSRVCAQLQVEPPSKPCIYLEWGDPCEFEYDPQEEWLMVEASNGYWEANKHTLKALQKLQGESFPLSEHIVDVNPRIGFPRYRQDKPQMDLGQATQRPESHECLNVFEDWPDLTEKDENGEAFSELDSSQLDALRRILTKRLAIVQGPPGTGKTHISIVALRTMLANMSNDDPPIIVSAHTNHALDQLLRHISKFEPRFIRLGGQTLDKDVIGPRTMQQIREDVTVESSTTTKQAVRNERSLLRELQEVLYPLTIDKPFSASTFKSLGLITEQQAKSLEEIPKDYVGEDFNDSDDPINIFCGNSLHRFKWANEASIIDIEFEECNDHRPEEEDVELEFKDDKFELLQGTNIHFQKGYYTSTHPEYSEDRAISCLKSYPDLSHMNPSYRGSVYSYLQKMAKAKILSRVRRIAADCKRLSKEFTIGRWEQDFAILRDQSTKIIGMTTTGLSKYRALISSLQPKIVLIEEAAETLEMYTSVACFPSLEHLILVGDHQQLRGHCNIKEFESEPWNLDVSLFERLVNNGLEFTQLKMQRRMRPGIREIVNPIYPELRDHPSVEDREDIPGMGGLNTCFISHSFPESNDDALSKQNLREAEFITNFYLYLVQNGLAPEEITILTFYNGQRKQILKSMAHNKVLCNLPRKVVTVDSYQGEENEVIILSLTRNNDRGVIGFLSVDNRVCVALSRARRGFYLFGDCIAIYQKSPLWNKVLKVMGEKQKKIMKMLPLICKNHGNATYISEPSEFEKIDGGCSQLCEADLPCGHQCHLRCHPQVHKDIACEQPCMKILPCGHQCSNQCWYPEHECSMCQDENRVDSSRGSSQTSNIEREIYSRDSHLPQFSDPVYPPAIYSVGWNGLPDTPHGHPFRAFAAGGVRAEDTRLRNEAEARRNMALNKAAQEKLVKEHIPIKPDKDILQEDDRAVKVVNTKKQGKKHGIEKAVEVEDLIQHGRDGLVKSTHPPDLVTDGTRDTTLKGGSPGKLRQKYREVWTPHAVEKRAEELRVGQTLRSENKCEDSSNSKSQLHNLASLLD